MFTTAHNNSQQNHTRNPHNLGGSEDVVMHTFSLLASDTSSEGMASAGRDVIGGNETRFGKMKGSTHEIGKR